MSLLKKQRLITLGPLLVNSIICAVIGLCIAYPLIMLDVENMKPAIIVMAWLAISI
jgi:hypothetical protein